ncbi:endogenous retrovirus group 3 member 1 Env polyprotein-like isoform X1 [Aquila chrysaetos chrysaetos]|uniref:endogenous retrovirus group 3 member 1 Env polyprotein-like isoform X1 n=1 Tax=Aquila chrysaetos chrysaetos TaxID=223781 RepID=UPI001B7D32A4|nr:endogenous retrovirus group 3 member 1 Env polyprotein-like isoform X1 [Aquila chrysaetos chrysaetos]
MFGIPPQTFFLLTIVATFNIWGNSCAPLIGSLWQNEFIVLGQQAANTFNLTNCWVCGGPLDLESWPWTAVPISPKWLVSNYSEVKNDSYWGEDTQPWAIRYPAQGEYCLNRTQKDGVPVGNSKCNWTYTYGNHCLTDGCRPINCSGNTNSDPISHNAGYQTYCSLFSSHSSNFVPRWPGWAWVNQTGHRKQFSNFWSSTNQSNNRLNVTCFWHRGSGAWKCKFTDKTYSWLPDGTQIWWSSDNKDCQGHLNMGPDGLPICWGTTEEVGKAMDRLLMNGPSNHPLGVDNTTYFQSPWTPTGLLENGTRALKGHYWVCGQHAYKLLPANWTGVCYVGVIHPLFFLLPENEGDGLGVKVYDDLNRYRRSIDTSVAGGSGQTWGKDEWTPQRIIQHYGPATWNPNEGVSGAREPIYNLNHIIRLQDVLEIITNQTANALDLLADQATQMRTAIFQHRMVLDHLLAEEGGVCGKLNDSNCCLKIDDSGKILTPAVLPFAKIYEHN